MKSENTKISKENKNVLLFIKAFSCMHLCFIPMTHGQCAVNSNVILGSGPCTYNIEASASFFTDFTFSRKTVAPLYIEDGDFVHVQFHLNSTSEPGNHLLLETCWVTETVDHVALELNNTVVDFPGCPKRGYNSVVKVIENGVSGDVRIRFPTFFLLPKKPEFYLHCTTGACEDCGPSGCSSAVPVKQTFTRTAGIVTIGPVIRQNKQAENAETESPSLLASTIFIVTITLICFVALVIIVIVFFLIRRCYMKKKVKQQAANGYNNPILISAKQRVQTSTFSTSDSNTTAVSTVDSSSNVFSADMSKTSV
ncbi:uncharacterized protein LOC143452324 [Clavelina lepadiformis]|uniref:uncharacterized protein LOC143452324 n=1 Tax=Clavelina lepadiformis TaxID=159417 RepID=UPI004041C4A9